MAQSSSLTCKMPMHKKAAIIFWVVCVLAPSRPLRGEDTVQSAAGTIKTDVVTIRVQRQHELVRPGSKSALAVHFELKKDWHFYASAETAPGQMNIKINPAAEDYITFASPVFPAAQLYFDKSSGKKLEVFSNNFTVFLPFSVSTSGPKSGETITTAVKIGIEAAVCSDIQCRVPDFGYLSTEVKIAADADMNSPNFVLPAPLTKAAQKSRATQTSQWANYSVWFALGLGFLAGLSLNIMPCVWPVLPIIVMRIVEQAKQDKGKSIAMGLTFCLGILLFFACLAGANIILQVVYGTVLQWGDQFRNPDFVAGMAVLLVVLALFMFGVFTIGIPSSISGKTGSGEGYSGAVGMGFLAAVLSTPCSFAILAAAFAWAQAQPLPMATLAIMTIGIGMALPYVILTSMPGLLKRLPKPGRWMELFKQAIGFVLLIIAVKLIAALPQVRRMNILYFAVVLAFAVWVWGSWVDYKTKSSRKRLIRIIAAALAITAGLAFLPAPTGDTIDWQNYDADVIEAAIKGKQPVLIKFTADWCLSCKLVERVVYSRKDIAQLIKQKAVLAIKADTTINSYPATIALKNTYNEPGVPVSILFLPDRYEPVRWRGLAFAGELKKLLEKIPSGK